MSSANKPTIKVHFCDFWNGFDSQNNLFVRYLQELCTVEVTPNNPDIVFYSVFGTQYLRYSCKRVLFLGENYRPNFNECDFALSFDFSEDPRNYRLPLYILYGDMEQLTKPRDAEKLFAEKTKFCNFLYSNPGPKKRIEFFKKLHAIKHVDSGGRVQNNMGIRIQDKDEFVRQYKFTLAFENGSYPGYTTEKCFTPLLLGSIPIYWGNPLVHKDFNTKSFINWHDYNNDNDVIEHVLEVDSNPKLWMNYIEQPVFINNTINEYVSKENILAFLQKILESSKKPVAQTSRLYTAPSLEKAVRFQAADSMFKVNTIVNKIKNFEISKLKFISSNGKVDVGTKHDGSK